ncbi:hypothetical protein FBUS_00611 [Fasciolopsis buskii]|uniref:Uncharacterized protein n=1 Tax=Fasciolopsis buskii TaxID=27845 RepID=A0A8E0RVN4_9TREM|nr:hypothetical protein FBUS_00611 [Fasciolopsis buski]
MASTAQQQTSPQNTLQTNRDGATSLNRTTSNGSLPLGQFKKPDSATFIPIGPAPPLITERKTILRHATSSQDSISGPLSSVGPIPACGLDDWKYRQEQMRQQQKQQQGQKMELYADPSPSGSLHFLRLPLGQINLSGIGASCASLLVHAPSLSRVSGQTDDDSVPPVDAESIGSSALWSQKPFGYMDPSKLGCPLCSRGDYSTMQATSTGQLARSRSLGALRLNPAISDCEIEADEAARAGAETSVKGLFRTEICLFHKTRGWIFNPQACPDNGLSVLWNKKSACSISMPNVSFPVFQLKDCIGDDPDQLPTPTVKVESDSVTQDASLNSVNTSKRKCQAWLQSWR